MSQTVTLELPDEVYQVIQRTARMLGRTTEDLAAEWLARHARKPRPHLSEEEMRAAWARLTRHAGAASLGHPTGADNESIDADLAREYGSTHEEDA